MPVNGTPAVGSIAQWNSYAGGTAVDGHVAYVEAVNGNTITISEDVYPAGPFSWRTVTSGDPKWPSNFIHFKDVPTEPSVGPNDPKGNFEGIQQVYGGVRLTGWALDPDTTSPIAVHVYEGTCCANPRGAFMANVPRGDVAVAFPGYGDQHGFDIILGIPAGTGGSKTYCVYAINTGAGGVSPKLGCRTINFNWNPVGNFEQIKRAPGGTHLTGWALDTETTQPIAVHAYEGTCCANPRGAFTANNSRPDVAAAFPGSGDQHGFETIVGAYPTAPATKTYCVYGINTGYGNVSPELGCRSITISPDTEGNFEGIESTTGGARLYGWTLDPDVAVSTSVHVYEGSSILAANAANVARPDVGLAWRDYGMDHGFDFVMPLTSGSHTLCVYGINDASTAGISKNLGCRTVTVT